MNAKKDEQQMLYPDAYMAIFNGSANTFYSLMYGASISRYILDDVEVTNTNVVGVTPTTDGRHVLYFWLGTYQRIRDFNWVGAPLYFRVPADAPYFHGNFFHNIGGTKRIDFLGDTPPSAATGGLFNHIPNLTEIRVPIGSGNVYKTKSGFTGVANKIVESSDFSVDVNNL